MGREDNPRRVGVARRRIFSELLPHDDLLDPRLLDALAARGIELLVAVFEGNTRRVPELVVTCRSRGIRVGVWPMLADADGRWASEVNAVRFASFVDALLAELDARVALPDVLVLDLEPPIREVRALLARGRGAPIESARVAARWLARRPDADATRALQDATLRARARGLEIFATVVPPLGARFAEPFAPALATPIDALEVDRVAPMLYTSLFEGYSRGALRRPDARALLAALARATARHVGPRAAVCLGAIGRGALGDERPYRSVAELADDVALARAAGIEDLALFDLAGAVATPPVDPWLDALARTEPARVRAAPTVRTRALLATLRGAAGLLARAQR